MKIACPKKNAVFCPYAPENCIFPLKNPISPREIMDFEDVGKFFPSENRDFPSQKACFLTRKGPIPPREI